MKTWETPDILTLDVTETLSGSNTKTVVDATWDEEIDGKMYTLNTYYPSGYTGSPTNN